MAEEVETGGLMRFRYTGEQPKIKEEHKKEIEAAYVRADERKKKEKTRKRILIVLGILVAIAAIIGLLFVVR